MLLNYEDMVDILKIRIVLYIYPRGPIGGFRETGYLREKIIRIRDIWGKIMGIRDCKRYIGIFNVNFDDTIRGDTGYLEKNLYRYDTQNSPSPTPLMGPHKMTNG